MVWRTSPLSHAAPCERIFLVSFVILCSVTLTCTCHWCNWLLLIIFIMISSSVAWSLYGLLVATVRVLITCTMWFLGTQHMSSLRGHENVAAGHFGCMNFIFASLWRVSISSIRPIQWCRSYRQQKNLVRGQQVSVGKRQERSQICMYNLNQWMLFWHQYKNFTKAQNNGSS